MKSKLKIISTATQDLLKRFLSNILVIINNKYKSSMFIFFLLLIVINSSDTNILAEDVFDDRLGSSINSVNTSTVSKNLENIYYEPLRLDIFTSFLTTTNSINNTTNYSSIAQIISANTLHMQDDLTETTSLAQEMSISYNKNYELHNYIKFSNNISIDINYPVCEDILINDLIHQNITSLASQFMYEFNDYASIDNIRFNEEKPKFNLNTSLYFYDDNVLFIKFEIDRSYIDTSNTLKYYDTYIYDLETNANLTDLTTESNNRINQISINDFFAGYYKDIFVEEAKNYFYNNYSIEINEQAEQFVEIAPTEYNYNTVFLKEDYFEVVMYDYILREEVLLNIEFNKLLPVINNKYLPSSISSYDSYDSYDNYEEEVLEAEQEIIELQSDLNNTQEVIQQEVIQQEVIQQEVVQQEVIQQEVVQQEVVQQEISQPEVPQETTQKLELPDNIRELDKYKPMVALTFDDGPSKESTNMILDTLEKHSSLATFFVVGNRLDAQAETLIRIAEAGHQIGNHTYNHPNLTNISTELIKQEIESSNDKIYTLTGVLPTIVRVPYGATNNNVKVSVDFPIIAWNRDTRDWSSRDAVAVKNAALETVVDGDIILMHDLYMSTAEACLTIIPELVNRGFELVTIDELMYYRDLVLENHQVYSKAPTLVK